VACGCCRRGSARTWAEVAYRADKATNQKVSDGTRTRDHLDHNQELYQLSYAHQGFRNLAVHPGRTRRARAPQCSEIS
jgi:hypothetical protein